MGEKKESNGCPNGRVESVIVMRAAQNAAYDARQRRILKRED
jgi:hypothetical protein